MALNSALQPFVRLAHANADLTTRFVMSPEVSGQMFDDGWKMLQLAQRSAMNLMQTQAFANLTQGLISNYTDFMLGLTQSGTALLNQSGPIAEQMRNMTQNAIDNTRDTMERTMRAA